MEKLNGMYSKSASSLIETAFVMPRMDGVQSISINMVDVISNIRIVENSIELIVERRVEFSPKTTQIIAKVKTVLETQSPISKAQFLEDIRAGLPILNSSFAKASLVISNISSLSTFGPIVSIPAYNPKQIVINE